MIIVLAGVMGSGKDTIGDILVKNHGFVKDAFAAPLKKMAKLAFPAFTEESLYGSSSQRETQYKEYPFSGVCPKCAQMCFDEFTIEPAERDCKAGMRYRCDRCDVEYPEFVTPRLALQSLGTEWGRRLYTGVWADAVFERIRQGANVGALVNHGICPNYVITDCRFFSEVVIAQRNGAIVVKLRRGENKSTSSHQSEAEFRTIPDSKFDYVFNNDVFDLDVLPREVEYMLACLVNYKHPT